MKIYAVYNSSSGNLVGVKSANSLSASSEGSVVELTSTIMNGYTLEQILKNITNLKYSSSKIQLQTNKSIDDMKLASLDPNFSSAIGRANTTGLFNWL